MTAQVDESRFRLPQLCVLTEMENPRMWIPVPHMYGVSPDTSTPQLRPDPLTARVNQGFTVELDPLTLSLQVTVLETAASQVHPKTTMHRIEPQLAPDASLVVQLPVDSKSHNLVKPSVVETIVALTEEMVLTSP